MQTYGNLCSLFYDHQEGYASAQEVRFYAQFLNPDSHNLEAMSGSGRLQIPLLQQGYTVDGVDASPTMLKHCRLRSATLNLSPILYEQRLEALELPYTTYATAFIAVGSFQLISQKATALQALHKLRAHMAHNATLLIDIFTPPVTATTHTSTAVARISATQEIHFSMHAQANRAEQRIDAHCTYTLYTHGTARQQEQELMQFRWYTDEELAQLLQEARFCVVTVHEQPFGPSGKSRIIEARAV